MESKVRRFTAAAAMVLVTTVGVQAVEAQEREQRTEASHNDSGHNGPDFDRWKPLLVTAAFVNLNDETVTLRGLNFGKQKPTVFCETEKMRVVRWSSTEIVVRFPSEVPDGTYLFTVARGNLDIE